VQAKQDYLYCQAQYPELICRLLSAQFMDDRRIAMFELAQSEQRVTIKEEKHYLLVPAEEISAADLRNYKNQ
jgi:hypothetical protein